MFMSEVFALTPDQGKYLLVGQLGSKAYGTDTAESDDDFSGVAIAPKSHYVGLDGWENSGTLKIKSQDPNYNAELTAFELRKFLRLCLAFNPNAIPLLYLRPADYVVTSWTGQMIIRNRDMFTSSNAYRTMTGYAESQRRAVVNGDTGKLGMKRKELVAKYGYDVKFASHTIRLLRMAIEFFRDGNLITYREHDKDELLDIRQGKWTLTRWLAEVDQLLILARLAEKEGNLPEKPMYAGVNHMCMDIVAIEVL